MSRLQSKILSTLGVLVLIIPLGAFTCTKQTQPSTAYIGTWTNTNANIKVRTKTGVLKYQFTPLAIPVSLVINAQGKANCRLGNVNLTNLSVLNNNGNSNKTGIIYIIRCGQVGKLNNTDPEAKKEIELWIKPIKTSNKLHVEIRQMHTLDPFPMGEVILERSR